MLMNRMIETKCWKISPFDVEDDDIHMVLLYNSHPRKGNANFSWDGILVMILSPVSRSHNLGWDSEKSTPHVDQYHGVTWDPMSNGRKFIWVKPGVISPL